MKYHEYINKKKELYGIFLQFLETETDDDYNYCSLIENIEQQEIQENRDEISLFLHLIVKISNHHHRNQNFSKKIEQILKYFFTSIKKNFTNSEIFSLFKSNKLLILYLIKNQIINVDETLVNQIIYRSEKKSIKYHQFFYPEIKSFINSQQLSDIEKEITAENPENLNDFEEKRKKGENNAYICELIRNDSIDDFVVLMNRNTSQLKAAIKPSIFETNPFLLINEPSLIEYAAFYGSFQIFQYLKLNNNDNKFSPSLWIYAIHGKNPEIIHILEENHVKAPNQSFISCYIESIKCHHNDIANYIKDVLLRENADINKYIFQYYNFEQMTNDLNLVFYYLCRYNYLKLVELYLEPKREEINEKITEIKLSLFSMEFI